MVPVMSNTSGTQVRSRVLVKVEAEIAGDAGGGATNQMSWVFPGETLRVGRSREKSQLAVESDPGISRQHFEISFDGHSCQIRDLASANGTLVNGQPIQSTVLADGDEVCAGSTVFSVRILSHAAAESNLVSDIPAPSSAPLVPSSATAGTLEDTVRARRPLAPAIVVLKLHEGGGSSTVVSRVMTWIHRGQTIGVGSSSLLADWTIVGDPQMKDLHFQVALNSESCMLRAMTEDAPTLVNGHRIWNTELRHQDLIMAGGTLFQVEFS